MPERDDIDLLRQYAENGSETAFATLVERHVNLVYSAALRRVGNSQAAEEIVQAVFIILARKAKSLGAGTVLAGWLYQTARLTAANFLRGEIRRQRREQEAFMQSTMNETEADAWSQIAPVLDDAIARLSKRDRNAILLRFFENKDLRAVGAALGASEDAAKMRVNRALVKLRNFFLKRGITFSAAVIAAAVSANSAQAAPVGLAQSVAAVAAVQGAAVSGSTLTLVKGALKFMAWTKAKAIATAGIGVLLVAGTTSVTVKEIHKHQHEAWQLENISSKFLLQLPYRTEILSTRSAERSGENGNGGSAAMADGRGYGINASIEDMLRWVFPGDHGELSPARVILATELTTNRYDYFSNLPNGSQAALEREIRGKFGITGRREMVETNVLFLKVNTAHTNGLRPSTSKTVSSNINDGSISVVGENMNGLAMTLEMQLGIPVVNQTGLSNNFDFDISWDDYAAGHPNLSGLRQALTYQLGLELDAGTAPVEMLVVEKAK